MDATRYKVFYFCLGFLVAILFSFASVLFAQTNVVKEQEFTYTSLCSGTFTRTDYPDRIKYTGTGDLADKYTYEVPILRVVSPTSSPVIR